MTVLRFTELENELTFGAEYYGRDVVASLKTLRSASCPKVSLRSLCKLITDGDHGSSEYVESGVPYILSEAVHEGWIDFDTCRFITKERHASLPRSVLRPGDVVVTKTGVYFGKSAVIPPGLGEANTIAHVAKLSVKPKAISPYFLSTFLNSKYGYHQLRRRGIKATRPEIKLVEFRDIEVPILSEEFQKCIEQEIRSAIKFRSEASARSYESQHLLLRALDLQEWQAPEPLTYTRTASETFASGRLDAEFYNPAATEILRRLEKMGAFELSEVATVGTGFPWKSEYFLDDVAEPGEPFVRIRNCRPGELDPQELDRLKTDYANAQGQPKAQADDLVVGMDGLRWFHASLLTGPCYVNQRVALIHLVDQARISPEFLLVFLNSLLGQRQFLRAMTIADTVGHITLEDVRRTLVPHVESKVHERVTSMVRSAFLANRTSLALLDCARRAVEIAIEQNETAALLLLAPPNH